MSKTKAGISDDFPDVINSCLDALFSVTDGSIASMLDAGSFLLLTLIWNAAKGDAQTALEMIAEANETMRKIVESGSADKMFDGPSESRPTLN